jgi:hypothetical protein
MDRGGLADLGQVNERQAVDAAGLGADRKGGVHNHPLPVRRVLVISDGRAGRRQPCLAEPGAQLLVQRADDRRYECGL